MGKKNRQLRLAITYCMTTNLRPSIAQRQVYLLAFEY